MSVPVESFDFIVNRRGGTVLKNGEEIVRKEVLSRFGDKAGSFTYVDGSKVAAAVKEWTLKNTGKNRALVIGGGDGTVMTAAEQVLGRNDVTLGILPLGTQNLFARQLGFSADFRKAAAQYKAGNTVEMDVGKVNGQHFLIGITIDQNSISYFKAREAVRDKKHLSALRKAMATATGLLAGKKEEFSITAGKDGLPQKISSRIIAITNNCIKPQPVKTLPLSAAAYKNIVTNVIGKGENTGTLSLYAFKGGAFRLAAILPDILRGKWDRNKAVKTENAAQFTIHADDDGAEKPLIVDGEIKKTRYPLNVSIIPKGLKVFKPQ